MPIYALDGKWKFRVAGPLKGKAPRHLKLDQWMDAPMPGTLHFPLQKLGKIPDPHDDRNELDVQWVDEQDWEIQRTLRASEVDCSKVRQQLVFDGIDTIAEISLNGKRVGASKNMFRQVVCDVRGVLRPGPNEVRILLKSPTAYAWKEAKKNGYRVDTDKSFKWETGETRESRRAWIRKVQCQFGWDWGLYLAVSGLWMPARLECSDAPRIASLQTTQKHKGLVGRPTQVHLTIQVRLEAQVPARGVLQISCGGKTVQIPAGLKTGENRLTAVLSLDRPKLWWPSGEGDQPLYDLKAVWKDGFGDSVEMTKRLGLRTVELVTKRDCSKDGVRGESFLFKVNNRPVFMKGANWIPSDHYVERCTPGLYRHLLGSAVQSHMNMLRVWGGGWYELDSFYDICDELGILVWQEFMMGCAVYPDTPEFLRELTEEVRYQVRRLSDHPCIALWCGDNENLTGLTHWWEKLPEGKSYPGIYRKVMESVKTACEKEDRGHRYWPSSPSNGNLDGRDPDDPNRGDVHYWKVWHWDRDFNDYLTVKPRFASEFGFQSFPEPRTLDAVVPPDQRNPSSWVMEHHQRSPKGNIRVTTALTREMPVPKDFDSFCWATQINHAAAMRVAVEHWRRIKPWCMGTLYWQLNDIWPVASWSSLDFHGRWKVLQHEAARFFDPLLASFVLQDGNLRLWVTSDIPKTLDLGGILEVRTWGGKLIGRKSLNVRLKVGESKQAASWTVEGLLKGKYHPRDAVCFARLKGNGHHTQNYTALVPWKWAALEQPKVRTFLRQGPRSLELVVKSGNVVPFFHAELKGQEGHFQGDWSILRPGKTNVLPWVPHSTLGAGPLTLAQARKRLKTFSFYDLFHKILSGRKV
jgi:beta-mannosidase